MEWYELYQARMNVFGSNTKEIYKKSTIDFISRTFYNSPAYTECEIIDETGNVLQLGVQIVDDNSLKKKPGSKIIIMPPGQVLYAGWLVKYSGNMWLCVASENVYDMYYRGVINLCNQHFKVKVDETKTLVGTDEIGRPIFETTPVYYETPCVVANKFQTMDDGGAINLPSGQILITIPYSPSTKIKEGLVFSMYGENYKIIDRDFSQVVNDKGVIQLIAQRIVGGDV